MATNGIQFYVFYNFGRHACITARERRPRPSCHLGSGSFAEAGVRWKMQLEIASEHKAPSRFSYLWFYLKSKTQIW